METLQPKLDELVKRLQEKLGTALTSLTNHEVTLDIQHSETIPVVDVQKLLPAADEKVVAVYIPVMGDVVGDIFVLLPEHSACTLADLMTSSEPGTTQSIQGFEASAIQELGNILTGVVVTEIADAFKLSIMLTIPNMAMDMASALIDQVLISYGETSDNLFMIGFPFAVQQYSVNGYFLLLFDSTSYDKMKAQALALSGGQG